MSAPVDPDVDDTLTNRGVNDPMTDEPPAMSREGLRAALLVVLVVVIFFWAPVAWAVVFLLGLPLDWFVR